ncbi:hypothetical protein [Lancefieldella rimae]|uniref:hypothetical protein n=1 Tax=Lancefieldella rimae TaxID=1383 RepID=UPI0028804763|nr:hypothetical protein [Lancefieldella rimae]
MNAKKIVTAGLGVALVLTLGACSGQAQSTSTSTQETASVEQKKPLDLSGKWHATNSGDEAAATMEAEIKDGTITIYLVNKKEDTKMLYWQGTVPTPDTTEDKYDFTSEADTEALSQSLLGSQDKTKDFKYENGTLSFDFTALGTTKTIKMEKE